MSEISIASISIGLREKTKIQRLLLDLSKQDYEEAESCTEYTDHLQDYSLREKGLVQDKPLNNILLRNKEIDIELRLRHEKRKQLQAYKNFESFREKLPAYKMKEHLIQMIEINQVLLIVGETGCGKTTQIPQFILDSFIESEKGSLCKIVCTQPRRISAIGVAERVADERCVPCGNGMDVGYQIRLENEMPGDQGSILFCTTGIILQQFQANPYLIGISHIIVDEVHERNLDSDFLLISLKDILKIRTDLKVILMSATLNAREFSAYFDNCQTINIPGYTFPVEVYMLEDMINLTKYIPQKQRKGRKNYSSELLDPRKKLKKDAFLRTLNANYSKNTIDVLSNWDENDIDLNLIVEMLCHISREDKEGAVLIFLPGWAEITKLYNLLNNNYFFKSGKFQIIPLHSMLSTINQKLVFEKPPPGIRKIIIATNIAETSITIDDVVYVIDAGQVKIKSLDPIKNIQLLKPEWIALSNMKQREGRAGRTQPGICYHMFTSFKKEELKPHQQPEMLCTTLEETILQIKLLKLGKAAPFLNKAINPPKAETVLLSLHNLRRLSALDDEEQLTPLGFHLARLPMDARTGKMIILGSMFSCLDPILSIAASLSFKEPFVLPLGKEEEVKKIKTKLDNNSCSDHLTFANAIMEWEKAQAERRGAEYCSEHFLSYTTLKMIINLKQQYAHYLKQLHFIPYVNFKRDEYNINSSNIPLLKAIICAGLYPNIARVNKMNHIMIAFTRTMPNLRAITEDGYNVCVHRKSVNCDRTSIESQWLAYHLKVMSSEIFLHDTTAVTPFSLIIFGGKLEIGQCHRSEKKVIVIDNWIGFKCDELTARVIMDLRCELDILMEHKIKNPGVINWNSDSREVKVLNGIIELISSEEVQAAGGSHSVFDDFDDLLTL